MKESSAVTVLFLLFVCMAVPLEAQQQEYSPIRHSLSPDSRTPALVPGVPYDLRYNAVNVQTHDGVSRTGFYSGLVNDSVMLVSGGEDVVIAFRDVKSFTIDTKQDGASSGLFGALAGVYLVAALSGEGSGPAGYAKDPFEFAPGSIVMALPGYALFGLFTFAGSQEFDFSGNPDRDAAELSALKEFLQGGPGRTKLHFVMHGGWVSTRNASKPSGLYSSIPIYNPAVLPAEVHDYKGLTSTNLLRRFQITYNIRRWLELGLAYVSVSEPPTSGFARTSLTDSVATFSGHSESFKGTAFLVVGVTEPLQDMLPHIVSIKAGAGVGIGTIDGQFERPLSTVVHVRQISYGHTYEYWRQQSYVSVPQVFSGMRLALSLFGSADLRLAQAVSVGFFADYTMLAGQGLPEVPEWNLGSRPLGNVCLGLVLGWHL